MFTFAHIQILTFTIMKPNYKEINEGLDSPQQRSYLHTRLEIYHKEIDERVEFYERRTYLKTLVQIYNKLKFQLVISLEFKDKNAVLRFVWRKDMSLYKEREDTLLDSIKYMIILLDTFIPE